MLEQRQLAERERVAGNAAFKAQQWTAAYAHYSTGLEAQRTNCALHANAALASLRMGCAVQAIEHCDRVVRILQFLLEKPQDPLLVKALVRRASARTTLRQFSGAVQVRVEIRGSGVKIQGLGTRWRLNRTQAKSVPHSQPFTLALPPP